MFILEVHILLYMFFRVFLSSWNNSHYIFQLFGKHWDRCHIFRRYFRRLNIEDLYFRRLQYRSCLIRNQYFHKHRFKPLSSNPYDSCSMEPLIAAYDYLYYIFNAQGSSYEAPLRVRVTLLKKSVEITEMYSTLMNKWFILNKM